MSDYDPNRLDPNRPDSRDVPFDSGSGFNWNWLLGGIAAVVLLLVAMSFMSNDRTAEGIAPSNETTGQSSPPPIVAPAEKMSPRPASPNQ
ncbi:MAG: hypothetical protein ABW198_10155 [Pseudorhodoplanes sp.]